jgi:hypothetical protein
MIVGIHVLLFSRASEENRALLQKILKTRTIDAGGGWPIMASPPAEIAVHPTDGAPSHEIWLMCDNLEKTLIELERVDVRATEKITEENWGKRTSVSLGAGENIGLYEPSHPSPIAGLRRRIAPTKTKKSGKTPAKRLPRKRT